MSDSELLRGGAPYFDEPRSPEIGDPSHGLQGVSPRDLFCHLAVDADVRIEYAAPGHAFAAAALGDARLPVAALVRRDLDPEAFVESLIAWGAAELDPRPLPAAASSWPARVVSEFAPVGLTDGIWLQGLVRLTAIEDEATMLLLAQLMRRFGDPGTRDARATTYAALLRGLGIPPARFTRWAAGDAPPCDDLSYEHALLGVTLGRCPSAFACETVGLNLWMAAIGPCPLLARLDPPLRAIPAAGAYLRHDEELSALARAAAVAVLRDRDRIEVRERICRGFAAASRSYQRWELGMRGGNVPITPRDFVLEIIGRKARFAIGHHEGRELGGRAIEDLFRGGPAGHAELLDRLAASRFVRPGSPETSWLVTRAISIDGPMFDAFTPGELRELRAWIAALGGPLDVATRAAPVRPEGVYHAPEAPEPLRRRASERFAAASDAELCFYLVNAERYPAVRPYARELATAVLAGVAQLLEDDPVLGAVPAPPYSERGVAEMVAETHARNVAQRRRGERDPWSDLHAKRAPIEDILDGFWLQGFADVTRIHLEEYGWLFRIYASEMGDGQLGWNHNAIARSGMVREVGPAAALALTDPRLYGAFSIRLPTLALLAMSVNTQHFLPELLGINLALEATGVGGWYQTMWKRALREGDRWQALYFRLHNSIDNYASGHTSWSIAAVQAFMTRVREAAPQAVEEQWRRIWRLWRVREIEMHGSDAERAALASAFEPVPGR